MQWTSSERGHVVKITEHGADTIEVHCITCEKGLAMLTSSDYPKYRLAMNAAWKAQEEHSRTQPEQLSLLP